MGAGAGEEYFETNPNDTSYELGDVDNTNRDLITDDGGNLPIDMRSPDVTQIMDQEKQACAILDTKEISDKLNGSIEKKLKA